MGSDFKMEGSYSDKFSFIGEWYNGQASLYQRFNIFYYPVDDTLELYDLKQKKTFMRRMKVTGVTLKDFYIGARVVIHGRIIKITAFANKDTQLRLEKETQIVFVLIKPQPMSTMGKILAKFCEGGLQVTRMKMGYLSMEDLNVLYSNSSMKDANFPFLLEYIQGRKCLGIEMMGKNAVEIALKIAGDRDPAKAEAGTVRALYGYNLVKNCVHVPDTIEDAQHCLDYFFSSNISLTPTLSNCTLCLIKPHAIRSNTMPLILEDIDENGFEVTALNMLLVEKENATEFYEVYKGIISEYQGVVDELASGPCVALEIVSKDKTVNSAIEFRKVVGPFDPEIARMLRPNTIRAKYGVSKVKNAVHCSDLPEDGLLEVEYFFKILAI